MTKQDEKILTHLTPVYSRADTYLCHIYFTNRDEYMYSVYEKVEKWVQKNGGRIERLSEKKIIGEKKGFLVRIVFPTYNKRDMKNIMATLYERELIGC